MIYWCVKVYLVFYRQIRQRKHLYCFVVITNKNAGISIVRRRAARTEKLNRTVSEINPEHVRFFITKTLKPLCTAAF
ncbi:hypothetical protein AYI69_g4961 [Smittium culicis]|uniref:Uncharacterized protein n=1 Tax=Smittium culicis TaxID=133412 RepID=A0A1R1Y9E1_9FUNG|nr:hypothetical protein AYI69_g4961 [Smittium culicis]